LGRSHAGANLDGRFGWPLFQWNCAFWRVHAALREACTSCRLGPNKLNFQTVLKELPRPHRCGAERYDAIR
jgi:hypothetical protein